VVVALLQASRGGHGDDHPTFAYAAQLLEDIAAVRRRETVRRSDDNSHRKMQNVRGDSSAVVGAGVGALLGQTLYNDDDLAVGDRGLVTADPSFEHASSIKLSNLTLNWGRVLGRSGEVAIMLSHVNKPWLIVLVALIAAHWLTETLSVPVSRLHAIVLWVSWQQRTSTDTFDVNRIREPLKQQLMAAGLESVSDDQLSALYRDLERLQAIQRIGLNTFRLKERVEIAPGAPGSE
jgi:hypothetical protein